METETTYNTTQHRPLFFFGCSGPSNGRPDGVEAPVLPPSVPHERHELEHGRDECCVVLYVVSVSTVLAFLRARARVIYPHLHTQITSCTGPNGSPAGARWFLSFTKRQTHRQRLIR